MTTANQRRATSQLTANNARVKILLRPRLRRDAEASPFLRGGNIQKKRKRQIAIERPIYAHLNRGIVAATEGMLRAARHAGDNWQNAIEQYELGAAYIAAISRTYRRAYYTIAPHFKFAEDAPGKRFADFADAYLLLHGAAKVRDASAGMKQAITTALLKGIADGGGERERAKEVMRKIPNKQVMPYYRAARIARTEAHDAATLAADNIAKNEYGASAKQWVASFGPRTRPTHAAASGQTREMHEAFNVGDAEIMRPGEATAPAKDRINCRCVVIYE